MAGEFNEAEMKQLLAEMGLKRLNPCWAKAEIVLGLIGAVVGLVLLRDPQPAEGNPCRVYDSNSLQE